MAEPPPEILELFDDASGDIAVGDLDAAVQQGMAALDIERRSLTDLVNRAADLDRVLQTRYRREALAAQFHDRYLEARRALSNNDTGLPG